MCSLISVFLPLFVFISKKRHIYSDAWFPIQRLGVAIDIYQVLNNVFESSPAPFAPYIFKRIHKKNLKRRSHNKVTFCSWFACHRASCGVIVKEKEGGRNKIIIYCAVLYAGVCAKCALSYFIQSSPKF